MFDLNTGDAPSESNFGPVLGGKATLLEQQPPQHQPRHDVESVFWVLVCCLVRAPPDGANDNPTRHSDCIFNDMLYHKIPPSPSNTRDEALRWTEKDWKEALHPKLQGLATMIVQMCELLCINWVLGQHRPTASCYIKDSNVLFSCKSEKSGRRGFGSIRKDQGPLTRAGQRGY